MRAIDMHSHYSTQKGYCEKTPEGLARIKKVFRCEIDYKTEREMAEDLRRADVKAIESTVRWYLENRPLPGGDTEQLSEDPFDYAAEDRLIKKFVEASNQVKELVPPRSDNRSYARPELSPKEGLK
jgi:hypothetical protein